MKSKSRYMSQTETAAAMVYRTRMAAAFAKASSLRRLSCSALKPLSALVGGLLG